MASHIMNEYREKLYLALLGNVEPLDRTDKARQALEYIAALDIVAIEPIIEEMLTEAALRAGKAS